MISGSDHCGSFNAVKDSMTASASAFGSLDSLSATSRYTEDFHSLVDSAAKRTKKTTWSIHSVLSRLAPESIDTGSDKKKALKVLSLKAKHIFTFVCYTSQVYLLQGIVTRILSLHQI